METRTLMPSLLCKQCGHVAAPGAHPRCHAYITSDHACRSKLSAPNFMQQQQLHLARSHALGFRQLLTSACAAVALNICQRLPKAYKGTTRTPTPATAHALNSGLPTGNVRTSVGQVHCPVLPRLAAPHQSGCGVHEQAMVQLHRQHRWGEEEGGTSCWTATAPRLENKKTALQGPPLMHPLQAICVSRISVVTR